MTGGEPSPNETAPVNWQVRLGAAGDIPEGLALAAEGIDNSGFPQLPIDPEHLRGNLERAITSDHALVLVLDVEGWGLQGASFWFVSPSIHTPELSLSLHTAYIRPAWRNARVFRGMHDWAVSWGKSKGVRQHLIGLETHEPGMDILWRRLGYTERSMHWGKLVGS